jgi:hypothetical protein
MMVMLKGFQTSFGRPKGTQPGTLVLIEGAGDLFTEWTNRTIAQVSGGLAGSPKSLSDISPGTVYFMEMEKGMALLRQEANEFLTSCNVIAPFTRSMIDSLLKASFDQLIVEDKGPENDRELMTKAHLMVPLTSFIYESDLFLAESEAPAKWKAGRK